MGPTQLLIKQGPVDISLGLKRQEREAAHSPPCNAELRIRRTIPSLPHIPSLVNCILVSARFEFRPEHPLFWLKNFVLSFGLCSLAKSFIFGGTGLLRLQDTTNWTVRPHGVKEASSIHYRENIKDRWTHAVKKALLNKLRRKQLHT
jgi:hypothetical protein